MNIEKKESGRTGKFFIKEDNDIVADISWLVNDEQNYVIDHTMVSDKLSGQGVGQKLIDAVVEMAREKKKKIVTACEYAQKVFQRNEKKYGDIWDKRE